MSAKPEMSIKAFYDQQTNTVSYVVSDDKTRSAAIIDPVLGIDYAAGQLSYAEADVIVDYVKSTGLQVAWLIETHVHADHLSASPYLQSLLGGKIAISEKIVEVQNVFGKMFNAGTSFERDGRQFDHLFTDNETYQIGQLTGKALLTPGHTPACMAHYIGDAIFVGDTLFMPDSGTARADFPGGDARTLYRSIKRILSMPSETRIFVCHDYAPNGRDIAWETTVGEELAHNIHIGGSISEDDFVAMRELRDQGLDMPRLIMPSIQINMRAGHMPPPEENGQVYIKVPVSDPRQ
ncbi:MBL fold metallo-hydrolase [Alphaproteobacteria bacterium]|nr:MBL fold metallo-hydrolase [Alphaproteobacteria bacterium]